MGKRVSPTHAIYNPGSGLQLNGSSTPESRQTICLSNFRGVYFKAGATKRKDFPFWTKKKVTFVDSYCNPSRRIHRDSPVPDRRASPAECTGHRFYTWPRWTGRSYWLPPPPWEVSVSDNNIHVCHGRKKQTDRKCKHRNRGVKKAIKTECKSTQEKKAARLKVYTQYTRHKRQQRVWYLRHFSESSSDPSEQSFSPSHCQCFGMQRPLLQRNLSSEQLVSVQDERGKENGDGVSKLTI